MRTLKLFVPILIVLALVLPGCTPRSTDDTNEATLQAAVQQTLDAENAAFTATAAARPTNTRRPTETTAPTSTPRALTPTPPLPSETPTPFQPPVPLVSVSVTTNCRGGPSTDFEMLGTLQAGDVAEVVGKVPSLNYWLIRTPGKTGTCWLWGEYATVVGNTALVPLVTPPPTPAMPVLVVSVDSPCYSGPGSGYVPQGTINVGERAAVLGRDPYSNFWLVDNPDAAGNCWVSGEHATLQGSLAMVATAVTPTSEGSGSGYRCSIEERGPDDGDVFEPGAEFDAFWEIKNTGDKTWKGGEVRYGYHSGTAMFEGKELFVLGEDMKNGDKMTIRLDMKAPEARGTYSMIWYMYYGEIQICTMPVLIEVR